MLTAWDQQYAAGKGVRRWPSELLLDFLARRLGRAALPAVVLDVGCGAGGNLCGIVGERCIAVGMDLSSEALRVARSNLSGLRPRVPCPPLVQADACALPFWPASFDAVVDVTMLQHLDFPNKLTALREAHRVLKPGGWLFSQHLACGTENYEGIFPGNPPVFLWDKVSAQLDLDLAGFESARVATLRREYPGIGWAQYLVVEARAE